MKRLSFVEGTLIEVGMRYAKVWSFLNRCVLGEDRDRKSGFRGQALVDVAGWQPCIMNPGFVDTVAMATDVSHKLKDHPHHTTRHPAVVTP